MHHFHNVTLRFSSVDKRCAPPSSMEEANDGEKENRPDQYQIGSTARMVQSTAPCVPSSCAAAS